MIVKKYKLISLIFLIVLFLIKAAPVLALLEVTYPSVFGLPALNDQPTLPDYVRYFFTIGIGLAIFAALLAIAYGGIKYLISFSRGKFTDDAKDWIKSGILGLLIVLCSYLIAYTINPQLVGLKLDPFPAIFYQIDSVSSNFLKKNSVTFQEIPIGVLSENLLTRKTDCYAFDFGGNPIDGNEIITNNNKKIKGPTYLDHDRVDCVQLMVDAAQKKAQLVAELSDKIIELMNQCDCEGKCDSVCNENQCVMQSNKKQGGEENECAGDRLFGMTEDQIKILCMGPCKEGPCKTQPEGPPDCCPQDSGVANPKNPKKNLTVKELIEHGPIKIDCIDGDDLCCIAEGREFKGLDEYRCPNPADKSTPCSNIASFVEEKIEYQKKTITIINKEKWDKLNLFQQLTYFKEKISESKQKIKNDSIELNSASSALKGCYLAKSYVDLLKDFWQTNTDDKIILIKKPFVDRETNKTISIQKYCDGYNYANSSCFKKCNDQCPDMGQEVLKCYQNCPTCDPSNKECLKKQEECVEDCYIDERLCHFSDDSSTKFSECMDSCKSDCSALCAKKYLPCSEDYKICANMCEGNSQCVLDNASDCLFKSSSIRDCVSQNLDRENMEFCINRAYTCKNGSDQYAGYIDCLDPLKNASVCPPDLYSSSYLYQKSECQKCPDPYATPKQGTACYDASKTNTACQDLCPETTKCPASADCGACSCDEINEEFDFSISQSKFSDEEDEKYSTYSVEISEYRMVGPECNKQSYNDDPLSFYCQESWWTDPKREGREENPIGNQRICSRADEIPVGKMVNDAQAWASLLLQAIDDVDGSIQKILKNMRKIGNAYITPPIQDYCKCEAKFVNNKPICKTDCEYNQQKVEEPVFDADGNIVGVVEKWVCGCSFIPCKGEPCKQIVDYLMEIWENYKNLKINYINFYTSLLKEPRSDILKELTYSRQKINECSLVSNNYGAQARMFSCSRVDDELIAPITGGSLKYGNTNYNSYCYGQDLGRVVGQPLSDNWFCCQEWQKDNP